MRIRAVAVTAVVACTLGWVGRAVFSEDAAPAKPTEAEMMAEIEKQAKPGEEHARLAKLVGEWNVHGKFHMMGKVTESDSTSKYESILGGRYVRQEVKGTFMGKPFEGFGVIGFNNGSKQYFNAWLDTAGTGMMSGTGVENEKGKCWTFNSSYDFGPAKMNFREEVKFSTDDEFTYTMYSKDGDKDELAMELTYKRKK